MRKIVFIFVAAFFLITMGSAQGTIYRPPNPVMNYVPQYIGIYDTYYSNYVTIGCRNCHGDRNAGAKRHQYTASAFADCPDGCPLSPPNCLTACHTDPNNPAAITSECRECHIDGGPMGNLGFPHHRSDLAGSAQCTTCHQPNLLVETRSVKPPFYYPVAYTRTPTPFNCENCHWPSGDRPHTAPPGWPRPIEANGPAASIGYNHPLHPSKPYIPMDGTHHEIDGNVMPYCYLCHAGDCAPSWDPDNPLLIRYCENCHSKDSLHGIDEHMTAGHGLTVNQKCAACHRGGIPDTSPVLGPVQPVIKLVNPGLGPAGTLCYITGENFGNWGDILLTPRMGETGQTRRISSGQCNWWSDEMIVFYVPSGLSSRNYNLKVETQNGISNIRVFTLTGKQPCIPCPTLVPNIDSMEPLLGAANSLVTIQGQNFGDRHTSDRDVLLSQSGVWIEAPILSWIDNKIQFRFPAWTFAPGTIPVKVQTEIGESNQIDFLLRDHPPLDSLEHTDTVSIRLFGTGGFGDTQEYVRPDGYGWKSAVTFNHPDETIIVAPGNITSWSDTEIQLTLPAIRFDFYGVTVVTRYFYDSDGNDGYTLGVDKVYQTITRDPQLFRPIGCSLVPDTTIIPRGGTLGFQGTVTNYTDKSATVLFATKVTLPNGNKYPPSGYLIGPLSISLGPYQSKSGHRSLTIPDTAPLETYTYHGYVGNYGVGIYDECTFTFEVTSSP